MARYLSLCYDKELKTEGFMLKKKKKKKAWDPTLDFKSWP